jgi:hypothetical protein
MGKFNACFPKEFDPKPGPAGFPHRKRPGNTLPGPAVSPTWTLPSAPGRKKNGGHGPAGNSLLSLSRPRGPPSAMLPGNLRPAGRLDSSGASKPHRALPLFHQHRYFAHPLGKLQHFFQVSGVIHNVPIIHFIAFPTFGLPGLLGVGSTDLAENGDLFGHHVLPANC